MTPHNLISKMSSRRLLLLSMDWTRPKDPPMSLGQASILANLRQYNIDVIAKAWSVNHPSFKYADIYDFIMFNSTNNTDIALGTYIWHEPQTQLLLNDLKKSNFSGRIILGGPQVSYTKKNLEHYYPQADIFIRGYAEEVLAELMLSDSKKRLQGVHYADTEDLGTSAGINLESLPSPYLEKIILPQTFIRWETQRGCPFSCAFCQHRESDPSKKKRQFNQSRIMKEINWIIDNPIISDIAVLDPTFNSGSQYLNTLETFVEGKYKGKLALQCRAEMINSRFLDLVEALNKTGRVVLEFGLQSVIKEELKIIKRPTSISRVSKVFTEIKRRNIEMEVSLIFGLPNQTVSSFRESINFCKNLGIQTIRAYPLMLLRGTPLFEMKDELKLVEGMNMGIDTNRIQENIPHVISSPSFTVEDWKIMASTL
jgi:radical SAM superfamily enzyme YgiQ (UPF0313 family)